MSKRPILTLLAACALFFATPAVPVAAQTISELASSLGASSPLVVTGRVAAMASRWDASAGAIYTYVTVTVTERLKGELAESTVVIKQLGGQVGNVGLRIGDQASYTVGEDVLLFLAVRPRDGTLYPAGFERGKWTLLTDLSTGQPRAAPPASARGSLAAPATAAEAGGLDLATVRNIVAATPPLPSDFVTTPQETRRASPAFAFLNTGGAPARWHQVDDDVDIEVQSQTPPGGVPGGQAQLDAAMAMWSNGGTRLTLGFTGSGPTPPTCYNFNPDGDRRIWVFYNDPCGEISDADPNTFGIGGGFFTSGDQRTINGQTFDAFVQGIAVLNNAGPHMASAGCFQDALTHTLGHAIGLGDTDSAGAIMRPTLPGGCGGGGQGLGADDVSGLRFIYPETASGGSPPHAPIAFNYSAMLSTVTLNWTPAVTGGPATSYLIDAGTAPGLTNITTLVVPATSTSLVIEGVPTGLYYLRVRARNVLGTSGPSPEQAVVVGACAAPGPPSSFGFNLLDQFVTLFWTPPASGGPVQGYTLVAGSAPGLSDILVAPYPASVTSVEAIAPFGNYYLRVFATNACGASPPTPDTFISVQPCAGPPNPPTNLTFIRNGNQVTFNWNAPAAGAAPAQYIFGVGSAPGGIELAVFATGNQATTFSVAAPPGNYFVKIVAINACGISALSNEVQVVVP